MIPKKVIVVWQDAVFVDAKARYEDLVRLEPITIKTIGWMIFQDKSKIVLALEVITDTEPVQYQNMTALPRGIVKKVNNI